MSSVHRLTAFAMLCALAVVFHFIESLIVIPVPVPGFRLGLANIVSLIALYMYDRKAMFAVGIVRVVFASLLRGMLFATSFWLSLAGVLFSAAIMGIAKRCRGFSIYGVSVLGSAFHCVGQVIAITVIYRQFFMQALLPVLVALSIPTGLLIAMLAKQVLTRMRIGEE